MAASKRKRRTARPRRAVPIVVPPRVPWFAPLFQCLRAHTREIKRAVETGLRSCWSVIKIYRASVGDRGRSFRLWSPRIVDAFRPRVSFDDAARFLYDAVEAAGLEHPQTVGYVDYRNALMTTVPRRLYGVEEPSGSSRVIIGLSQLAPSCDDPNGLTDNATRRIRYASVSIRPGDLRQVIKTWIDALSAWNSGSVM
jgi:hypothetical protein